MTRRSWFYFVVVSILWGMPYLFIRIAIGELSPVAIAFLRIGGAAAVLLPVALFAGALRVIHRELATVLILAITEMVVPYVLINLGVTRISTSLTGILVATQPLFVTSLAGWMDPSQRPNASGLVGLACGLMGVGLLLGFDFRGTSDELIGGIFVLCASLSYAAGAVYLGRRFAVVQPLGLAAGAFAASALLLAVPAFLAGPKTLPTPAVLLAIVVLALFCTAVAYWLWFWLIAETGPGNASLVAYLAPAVAVFAGGYVLREPITPAMLLGLLLILMGCGLASQRWDKKARTIKGEPF